jgi:putative membrane protein
VRGTFRYLRHLLQGVGIGIANVIPGVSGGTMALIFGIYEEVIAAASDGVQAGLSLIRGDLRGCLDGLRQLPWGFLAPLAVGMLATPFLGAGLLSRWLEAEPEVMRGLFFGLIVGSLPIPWLRIRDRRMFAYFLVAAAAAMAWMLGSLPTGGLTTPSHWQVFGAAALAISAMVLPGVSGAYLLLVFGMYEVTLTALRDLDLAFIAVFGLGAAVGLAGFSVLLNWLLKHRHDATMAVLVGLMVGSLRALWPWQSAQGSPELPSTGGGMELVLILGLAGALVTGGLSWWELRRN